MPMAGFLHHIRNVIDAGSDFFTHYDTVTVYLVCGYFHDSDNRHVVFGRHLDKLRQSRVIADHKVVADHDRKGFVTYHLLGAPAPHGRDRAVSSDERT